MACHPLRQEPQANRRETIASRHKPLVQTVDMDCLLRCHCRHHRSSRILELLNNSLGPIIIIIDDARVHEKDGTVVRGVVVGVEVGV